MKKDIKDFNSFYDFLKYVVQKFKDFNKRIEQLENNS